MMPAALLRWLTREGRLRSLAVVGYWGALGLLAEGERVVTGSKIRASESARRNKRTYEGRNGPRGCEMAGAQAGAPRASW
jgi:hypothetical protein